MGKITTNSQNSLAVFFLPLLYLFGWSRVEFPLCRECKPRFYMQRWGRTVVCWSIIIVAIFAFMPYFETSSRLARRLAVGGIAMLALAPYILFELFVPRSFEVTSSGATRTYEFASQEYAIHFYALNCAEYPHAKIEMC